MRTSQLARSSRGAWPAPWLVRLKGVKRRRKVEVDADGEYCNLPPGGPGREPGGAVIDVAGGRHPDQETGSDYAERQKCELHESGDQTGILS
jgi:hypothetical protein